MDELTRMATLATKMPRSCVEMGNNIWEAFYLGEAWAKKKGGITKRVGDLVITVPEGKTMECPACGQELSKPSA